VIFSGLWFLLIGCDNLSLKRRYTNKEMAIKKFIILIISVFISINSYSQQGKNTEKSKEINEATVTYKRKVPATKTTEPTPAKPEQALAPTAA
jgi:hypothetical protein